MNHMEQSQNVVQWLKELTQLEREKSRITKAKGALGDLPQKIDAVRNLLPTSILSYHDALKASGRRSIAPVRNGVCGGCHLAVPRGTALDLRRSNGQLTVCNNCGVFIYLSEEEQQPAVAPAPATVSKTRKKTTKKVAVAAV